ncbi:hypothetical protein DAI22_01g415300 [Oryza sativa Japonica Group]|nr:hypothetical protein DAI22_01g415300 [Oryza sativa Japonica Group]
MSQLLTPVSLFRPSLPPGSQVSPKWSKLCQRMMEVFDASARTRLPESRMTPTVELEVKLEMFVDQIAVVELSSNTMLPSVAMVSCEVSGFEIGEPLFATQTGVCLEIW